MEDSYYVFKSSEYSPPSTLGELMETVNLSKVVELSRFSEKEDNPNSNHFVLNNDDYIWEVLTDCKSAVFVEDESWMVGDRDYLSFTITSDSLGAYKAALYVTEDGYLWTNAFDWQYLFNIGEEAAGKIIKYAKENPSKQNMKRIGTRLPVQSLRSQKNISLWMILFCARIRQTVSPTKFY